MARLVLINGAPGSGKSTLAHALAARRPLALALDVDQLKHALGGWQAAPDASGLQARRLALAVAREHLRSRHDVYVGQYLARTAFLEALEALAGECSASFHEFVLDVDAARLADRLRARAASPARPEHTINARLALPSDAEDLVRSLAGLRTSRPRATWVDAGAPLDRVAAAIEEALA